MPVTFKHVGSGELMMLGYLHGVFSHFMYNRRGISIDTENPDVYLFSIYDPTEVFSLRSLRQKNKDKLIIVGGVEGFHPSYLLRFADYVCVGEGFHFMKNVPTDSVESIRAFCDAQPYMASKEKLGKSIQPNFEIPWKELPLVHSYSHVYHYLVAKGCKNKCAFCAASWHHPYAVNPRHDLKQFEKIKTGQTHAVYFIGNDSGDFSLPSNSRPAASVTIKKFLQNPWKYKKCMMLRMGVEGTTEERRKMYGKPISNEEIRKMMAATKTIRVNTELFFIVQTPFDLAEFRDIIPYDTDAYPRVTLKFTFLQPTPLTPFAKFDLSGEESIDAKYWHNFMNAKNRRFRIFPPGKIAKSHTGTMLRRATIVDVDKIMDTRKFWNDFPAWRNAIREAGLWPIYEGNFEREFDIISPWEKTLKPIEKKLNERNYR